MAEQLPATCALCKRLIRDPQAPTLFRLHPADITAAGEDPAKVPPGLYSGCPDCFTKYHPHIHKRVTADRKMDVPLECFGGNDLV